MNTYICSRYNYTGQQQ